MGVSALNPASAFISWMALRIFSSCSGSLRPACRKSRTISLSWRLTMRHVLPQGWLVPGPATQLPAQSASAASPGPTGTHKQNEIVVALQSTLLFCVSRKKNYLLGFHPRRPFIHPSFQKRKPSMLRGTSRLQCPVQGRLHALPCRPGILHSISIGTLWTNTTYVSIHQSSALNSLAWHTLAATCASSRACSSQCILAACSLRRILSATDSALKNASSEESCARR